MTGLERFKLLLKEFRNLALWAAGGTVFLPFIASFIAIIPPWPNGLNIMTAVFQFVALMVIYQIYEGKPRRVISRNIGILAAASFAIVLCYIVVFTMFTIYIPGAKGSIVIGFRCSDAAAQRYGDKCPFLGLHELSGVSFDQFELWTSWSIAIMRMILVALWFLFFISLAALMGKFLIFQMRERRA
jgi:hypothetical protein